MPLNTTTDYQLACNQLFWYIENVGGGIDKNGLWVTTSMLPEDFQTLLAAYLTYKKTYRARPTNQELYPNSHGINQTVFFGGEGPVNSPPSP